MKTPLALILTASLCLAQITHAAASDGATRRFALVIGAHEGGKGRDRLLYSGSDARAFQNTLQELGGLSSVDANLLIDPDSAGLQRAFEKLAARVQVARRDGARTEAVVYYSGHADENGLQLGKERFDYRAFRERMNALGADVRIAVVDACASGALTRMKGGTPVQAFMVDRSARAEGYAFLTSSSESEVAQESDRLRGSFFTHALTTGLRGAADATRDGRVTLHEAYQFAYHETLARTVSTRGGPQHAAYDIQLSGSGDVVLTDLRQATASLVLAEALHGRLFIRDSLDHLTAELNKPAGREMNFGLPPGTYGLRLQQGTSWSGATVTLLEGKSAVLDPSSFRPVESEPTAFRGGEGDSGRAFRHLQGTGNPGFSASFLYDAKKEDWYGTQIALLATDGRKNRRGGQVAVGFNFTRGDLEGYQGAAGLNVVGGALQGFQFAQIGNFTAEDAHGTQFSGIFGATGGGLNGVQVAGILNLAGGGVEGLQGAGIFNISGDSVRGLQIGGIFNIAAESVRGGQGAGIFNIAGGKIKGGQGAGIFNITARDIIGGQGAGIFNVAGGDITGGQGAAIFNATAGSLRGIQGSAILNFAGRVEGLASDRGSMPGFQITSILNVAGKVNGHQIGLVNLSDDYQSGFPLGLVNISRKGAFHGITWVDETGMAYAGLRTGVRSVYSILAVGTNAFDDQSLFAPTFGMGARFSLGKSWFLEPDLMYSTLFESKNYSFDDAEVNTEWSRLRFAAGWEFLPYASVFWGVAYNVAVHTQTDAPVTGSNFPFFTSVSHHVSMWPGAFLGIRVGK